jgi:flagellar motor switch/type III secretory pathway protein FliN
MWDKIVPGPMQALKFSAYPWGALPRRTRREAAIESTIAGWLAVRPPARLLDGLVRVTGVRGGPAGIDPAGACCELAIGGEVIEIHGTGALVRVLAERWLGGPPELPAPRPLGVVEHALWAHAVAIAARELAITGEVKPRLAMAPPREGLAVELTLEVGGRAGSVVVIAPSALELRVSPARTPPPWSQRLAIDAPVVVARCLLDRDALAHLAVRDLVTVEPCCELEILGGTIELAPRQNAVVAEVRSEYSRRAMAIADDAQVEFAVTLGTARLSLRQTLDLAIGQIVQLGRPLAGPFEVRAAGRIIGQGELVDVDGELAVRIVSLDEKSE